MSETPSHDLPEADSPDTDSPADRQGSPGPLARALTSPPSTADIVITRIILLLVIAAAVVTVVVSLWPSEAVHWTTAAASGTPMLPPAGAATNLSLAYPDEWVWTITGPTLAQRILVALPTVVTAVLVGLGAWLLQGITLLIHRGQAFSPATINRLRALAIMVLIGGLVVPFVEVATRFALAAQVLEQAELLLHFDATVFWPVLVGLLLLLLTEVFVKGRRMGEDLEGLV